jgi:hypothetical protein
MFSIRFVGGGMDGKKGRDVAAPLTVTYTHAGQQDVYVRSSQDPDGTLVYRKRN